MICMLNSELDKAGAFTDEPKQMSSGRVVRTLFDISTESKKRRKEVVGRCVVAIARGKEMLEFAFRVLDVCLRLRVPMSNSTTKTISPR
jgi:hypothetical protein